MQVEFVIELMAVNQYTAVFFIAGNINVETAPSVLARISNVVEQQSARSVVVDISRVPSISSAGVGIFMQLLDRMNDRGGPIILVNANESIKRVLSMLGFLRYFTFASSMKEAHQLLLDHFGNSPLPS